MILLAKSVPTNNLQGKGNCHRGGIPSRTQVCGEEAGSPLFKEVIWEEKVLTKTKEKDAIYAYRQQKKWEQIDKLSTLDRYANSFNMLINDALDYGLPMLIKEAFGEIDYEEETKQYNAVHSKEEEFMGR